MRPTGSFIAECTYHNSLQHLARSRVSRNSCVASRLSKRIDDLLHSTNTSHREPGKRWIEGPSKWTSLRLDEWDQPTLKRESSFNCFFKQSSKRYVWQLEWPIGSPSSKPTWNRIGSIFTVVLTVNHEGKQNNEWHCEKGILECSCIHVQKNHKNSRIKLRATHAKIASELIF